MKEEISNIRNQAIASITGAKTSSEIESLKIKFLGRKGKLASITKNIGLLKSDEKKQLGILINQTKNTISSELQIKLSSLQKSSYSDLDLTTPAIVPSIGHLHLITQTIEEISNIFERIGFNRARYSEVEWDWFAFEALGFTKNHPARDEWETFIIDAPPHTKLGPLVLTPHTSSGQIREMQRVKNPPIRMINIAKCHRRESDVTHYPMFHQVEGLLIDEDITIANLIGILKYFVKNFFGEDREIRLRPYNFPFTEPSFEVDISCGICHGKTILPSGKPCRSCKQGWHEIAGAGIVHPNVLKNGGIDPNKFTGLAFGLGIERPLMMREGLSIPDIRQLYSTDLRYLTQF